MRALGQGPGTVLAAQERCCGSDAGACMHPAHRDCCCCCCARLVAISCCANWAISLCDLTAAVGARNDDARQMSHLSAATTPSVQPRLPDCAESAVWRRGVHGRTDTRRSGWGKASIARRRGGDASDGEDAHLTIASDAARSVEGEERTWTQSGLGNLIAEVRNAPNENEIELCRPSAKNSKIFWGCTDTQWSRGTCRNNMKKHRSALPPLT